MNIFQFPPALIPFIVFAATTTVAIIALGLSGSLCNGWAYCSVQGTVAAGPALGIVSSIFGGLFAGLAICWFLFVPLWKFNHMKIVILPGLACVATFSFISAVILAWTCNNFSVGGSYGTCGAASAFQFLLMFSVIACGILVYLTDTTVSAVNNTAATSTTTSSTSASVPPAVNAKQNEIDV